MHTPAQRRAGVPRADPHVKACHDLLGNAPLESTRTIEYAYRALRPGPITSRRRLRLTVRTKSGRIYHRRSSARR